jgi:hypothetical protein
MDEDLPICLTCGVQYSSEPQVCKICSDERQYVGWKGQEWTTIAGLRTAGHRGVVRPEAHGLHGVGAEPAVGIGQRGLVVPGPGGNVLWDCFGYLDDEAVAAVTRLGGLAAIALSHPHFYGAMIAWSRAFGGVPVYVHAADREWVCRDGNIVFWEGERLEILPGRTLVNCGVHFPGGTVLHWAGGGAGGAGALCSGDIFTVVMDRRWVSFMYSYPNLIPEHPDTIARAIRLVEPLPFDTIYGGWWGRVVDGGAKAALTNSAARYFHHIGHSPSPAILDR